MTAPNTASTQSTAAADAPVSATGTTEPCHDLLAAAAALAPWWSELRQNEAATLPAETLAFPLLDHLAKKFALAPFETNVIFLLALVEVDPRALPALEAAGAAVGSLSSASLQLLFPDHYDARALLENGPLRRWGLAESRNNRFENTPLVHRFLALNPRILAFLLRTATLDDTLAPYLEPVASEPVLTPAQVAATEAVVTTLSGPTHFEAYVPVLIRCAEADTVCAAATEACRRTGLRLLALDARNIPEDQRERRDWIRRWELEALLSETALFIDATAARTEGPAHEAVRDLARHCRGAVLIGSRTRLPLPPQAIEHTIPEITTAERAGLIAALMEKAPDAPSPEACRLAEQFRLSATTLYRGCLQIPDPSDDAPPPLERLWTFCRREARPAEERLMQPISSQVDWSDLVLPDATLATLRELTAQLRHRTTVYADWGFAAKSTRGLNLTALFSGASGTGKTLAAEVVANDLRLDLMRVDLSAVVSKYIGETEENLREVFDAAESGGIVLLFDEADALFGPRSKVNDSKDRNANIEVSYLLQRLEGYRGLAILTTNFRENIDPAFLRRIRFHLDFPFPDPATRARIWKTVFPADTPLDAIDFDRVARLSLTGGHIRNIALNAAFLAAEEGTPVRHHHLATAARNEFRKSEKPCPENELRALRNGHAH